MTAAYCLQSTGRSRGLAEARSGRTLQAMMRHLALALMCGGEHLEDFELTIH